MDNITFNILPFISELISTNKRLYPVIDALYKKDELKFYRAATGSDYLNLFMDSSVIQDSYYRKSLGILISDDIASVKILNALKNEYKYQYTYVKSRKEFKMSEFFKSFHKKFNKVKMTDGELNFHMLVALFFAMNLNVSIDTADRVFAILINTCLLYINHKNNNFRIGYDKISNEEMAILKEKLNEIIEKVPRIKDSTLINSCKNGIDEFSGLIDIGKLTEEDRNSLSYEYLYDIFGLDLDKVSNNTMFSEKELITILYCYYSAYKTLDDTTQITKWLNTSLQISYLLKAYNAAKEFVKNNSNESILLNNREKEEKIQMLEDEKSKLLSENNDLVNTIEVLKRENQRISLENSKLKKDKLEITELRNFIFNKQQKEDPIINENDNYILESLNKVNGVIIGGHNNWITKMKEKLSWTYIGADVSNFDINLLKGKQVILNTDYLSHGTYYKVIEHINIIKSFKFISNTTNIDLSIKKISELIES